MFIITINLIRNIGVLGKEKTWVYTYEVPHSMAKYSEKIELEIPEGWSVNINWLGNMTLTAPWGMQYQLHEVLGGDERPYFYCLDDGWNTYKKYLKIVSIKPY